MESQAVKQPAAGSLTRWLNGPFDSSISAKHCDWRSEVCDVDVAENTTMYRILQCFYVLWGRNHCKYRRFWACRGQKHHFLPYCSVFVMLCEGENTVNIDVFELAVAQNTAIYSVFEPAVKKHCNLRRFQQRGRQKRCYLRGFLRFRAKTSSLDNLQKHCKNQCFCPAKTAKTVAQTAPKSQNLVRRPPDKRHEKKGTSWNRKSKNCQKT